MTLRHTFQTLIAALLTTFALVSVAQPSVAAISTGTIKGVAALDGTGVAGIKAHLMQSEDEGDFYNPIATAVTSSKGAYSFTKVPVNLDGLSYHVIFTDSTHKIVTADRRVVPKANTTVTRNVTLKRAATLTGTLSRQDGTTPHNISVYVQGAGPDATDNGLARYNAPTHVHVHTNGTYTFAGLAAGTTSVQFSDDSGTYLDQCYNNLLAELLDGHYPQCDADTTPSATRVTLTGGQTTTLSAQTMTHLAGHISGTVKDTDGNVLKDIDVVAFPAGDGSTNGPLWNSLSSSAGTFKISALPAGDWQLFAEDRGSNIWAPQWYDRKPSQTGSAVIHVGAGDTKNATITMLSRSILKATATAGHGSATFEVLTTRKAGGPRPGGSVTVNQGYKTTTKDLVNGRATITLSGLTPGKRTITVTYSGNSTTAGTSKTVVVMVK